jgi:preprotein translocase subunit SecA
MIFELLKKVFGTQNDREIRKLMPSVQKINDLEKELSEKTDDELRSRAALLREKIVGKRTEMDDRIKEARALVSTSISDQERKKYKKQLKELRNGVFEEAVPEVFALVREASKRTIGLRHFDVQLMGGLVLHHGEIAEMTTGEGKTLVATLAASLNAMTGEGVHIVTVNDYLAKRDSEWMGPIYKFLGLSVGVIQHDIPQEEKQRAYACDITYGTNNEFGFDYLRDNMVIDRGDMVQRYPAYAIVDEVDSILVDEARTPLIISGPVDEHNEAYNTMRPIVEEVVKQQKRLIREKLSFFKAMAKDTKDEEAGRTLYLIQKGDPKNREFLDMVLKDRRIKGLLDQAQATYESKIMDKERDELLEGLFYVYDEKTKESTFSAKGQAFMREKFGIEFMLEDIEAQIADMADREMPDEERMKEEAALTEAYTLQQRNVEGLKQLLKAYILFAKDVDYVVHENKIIIVDEFTGRMMPGRRFSDGIHEAIEAKENVEVQKESQTLATITLQNYFRMYDKIAGMTGTAKTEESEFESIYLLPVIQVPTNRTLRRKSLPDRIYKTEKEKFDAIANDLAEMHAKGQPALVGTISIEKSEGLSRILMDKGIPHNVLNAKYHEKEASIIAQAGRFGTVTIATNMAGRGTDILLGGNSEFLARDAVRRLEIDDPAQIEEVFFNYLKQAKEDTKNEHDKVVEAGGLCVIGTERHESRRIDDQLRGRCGRQGDPGASRFYLSLEDDLMRVFGSDKIKMVMDRLGMEEGEVIENPLVTRAIRTAQKRVEMHNFEIRKHLLKYDDIMNRQREVIYKRRRMMLDGSGSKEEFFECVGAIVDFLLEGWNDDPEPAALSRELLLRFAISIKPDTFLDTSEEGAREIILEHAEKHYALREKLLGEERMRHLERMVMLSVIDLNWKVYLRDIDDLRENISWQAYAQKDPFIEFQHEAFKSFKELMFRIDMETSERIMKISAMEEQNKKNVFAHDRQVLEHREFSALEHTRGQADANSGEEAGHRTQGTAMMPPQRKERVTFHREEPKVGRNDVCPCGSGKKYKKCCGG